MNLIESIEAAVEILRLGHLSGPREDADRDYWIDEPNFHDPSREEGDR